jgi:GTP-binding protein EngB required for normal cell division
MSTEGKNTVIEFLSEFLDESNNIESEAFKEVFEKINEEKQKIEKFLEDYIHPIILNDNLFSYEEEKENLLKLEEEKKAFFYQLEKFWLYEKFVIAFAGRFSSGKSSVINTLLGVKQLLPTDVTPTTAIPTYLTSISGLNEDKIKDKFLVVSKEENNGSPKAKLMDLKYLLELRHNDLKKISIPLTRFISSFVIFPESIKHLSSISANLDNLAIVDTPGFDSADKESDRVFTRETLINSDVVFWVIDINDGDIPKHALEFLKEIGKEEGLPFDLYIILNKADTKPPKAVEKVKQKVEKSLTENNIPFKGVIPFSAKKPDKFKENLIFLRNLIFKELSEKALEKSPKYLFFNFLEVNLLNWEERLNYLIDEYSSLYKKLRELYEEDIKIRQESIQQIIKKLGENKYILLEIERYLQEHKKENQIVNEDMDEFKENILENKGNRQDEKDNLEIKEEENQRPLDIIWQILEKEYIEAKSNLIKMIIPQTIVHFEAEAIGILHDADHFLRKLIEELQDKILNFPDPFIKSFRTYGDLTNLIVDYIILKKEIEHYEELLDFLEESYINKTLEELYELKEKVEKAKLKIEKYKKDVKTIEDLIQRLSISAVIKWIFSKLFGG